ncbi:hypothetical protein AGR9A_Cc70027 [Agrobacterium salinitolerans str. Hayward 0363]|nr:hypothetical protein AGR9A_Cc70027 [Agrobacterium salinitolerans str. Hayward 0363]
MHVKRPDHRGFASRIIGSGRICIMHAPQKAAHPLKCGEAASRVGTATRQQAETPGRISGKKRKHAIFQPSPSIYFPVK